MAKILVADDNSNIQKMVGLALKDQGIDVVAVGNGEAAVRKISDVRPDLVLADVFMPVRNGYEVCNYVKQDSKLSHIPVILLVGAFDPLDEQEAQRVGADGVLKKPFVPPDPLISMVKSALTRAGVALGASEPAAPPPPPPPASFAKPELPRVVPPPPPPPAPEPEIDLGVPVFSSRPTPVNVDKTDQPVAFGSLLDTPAEEEAATFTTSSGSAVAPDRDWGHHAEQAEEEAEEETSKSGSWRLSAMDELPDETPAGQTDWREAAFAGIGTEGSAKQWAPSAEKNSLSITEEEAAELAKKDERFGTPAVSGKEDWSKAISELFPEKAVETPSYYGTPAATPEPQPVVTPAQVTNAPEPVPASPKAAAPPPPAPTAPVRAPVETPSAETSPALNSWMAGAVSPSASAWEAELQRANELTSTWDSASITPEVAASATEDFLDSGLMATVREPMAEAVREEKAHEPRVVENALETTSEEVPQVSAYSGAREPESPAVESSVMAEAAPVKPVEVAPPAAASEANSTAAAPSTNMDELVAKVLSKMNPDVLQALTRELLKPVVEALVKDELNKK